MTAVCLKNNSGVTVLNYYKEVIWNGTVPKERTF